MSLFEFVSGMIGVLIALAIAQLLVSTGRLAQNHSRVVFSWPHALWNGAIFLMAFLHWWSLWDFRELDWNSAMFFYSLGGPIGLFFGVTLLSPEVKTTDQRIDLNEHFAEVRPLFLGVMLTALGFMSFDGPMFGTESWFNSLRLTQLLLAGIIVLAWVSARPAVQLVTSAAALLVLTSGMVIRFFPGHIL